MIRYKSLYSFSHFNLLFVVIAKLQEYLLHMEDTTEGVSAAVFESTWLHR